jgi:hypothetical protein
VLFPRHGWAQGGHFSEVIRRGWGAFCGSKPKVCCSCVVLNVGVRPPRGCRAVLDRVNGIGELLGKVGLFIYEIQKFLMRCCGHPTFSADEVSNLLFNVVFLELVKKKLSDTLLIFKEAFKFTNPNIDVVEVFEGVSTGMVPSIVEGREDFFKVILVIGHDIEFRKSEIIDNEGEGASVIGEKIVGSGRGHSQLLVVVEQRVLVGLVYGKLC